MLAGKPALDKQVMFHYLETNPTPEEYNFLRNAVGWGEYDPEGIVSGLKNTLYGVLAKDQNRIIGMGRVIGDGKLVFYIQDIIVLPEFQNKGIGKTMMQMIMQYIEKNSIHNSIIGLMSASGKEEFYKKFGFIARPNEKMGAGMTIFIKKGG